MADVKISDLTSASALTGTELLEVVQGGVSKKATASQFTSGGGAVSSVNGQTGAVTLTKSDVTLGNVDNTSDANKPVSTAQSAAISAVGIVNIGNIGQLAHYASSGTGVSGLGTGTSGHVLTSGGAGVAPSWLPSSGIVTTSISGTTTLDATALDKIHICTGTSANYTITLSVSAVGNSDRVIAFKGSHSLTRFVTIDANSTETIDGTLTKIIWAGEYFLMVSDGTNWVVLNENRKALMALMRLSANQGSIASSTLTKININAVDIDNSLRMSNVASNRIDIRRSGLYNIVSIVQWSGITAAGLRFIAGISKNGASIFGADMGAHAASMFPQPQAIFRAQLEVGDYIELTGFHSASGSQIAFGQLTGTSSCLQVQEIL